MPRKGSIVTQADIARKAEVSPMTVSYALRGSPVVSEKTREKVVRVAEELGYRPNAMVSNLMNYVRAGKVSEAQARLAVVWAGFSEEKVRDQPSLRELQKGILEQAERAGFHLDRFHLPEAGLRGERLSDILWNRGIVGVLLVAGHEANELLQGFDTSRFALATCSYGLSDPPLHRVCAHHFGLMREGVRHLMNSGAKRVGVVLPAYLDEPVHIHKAAVRSVELEWGRRRICSLMDFEGDPDVFEAWMKKTNPDVLLAGTLGCARHLQSFGAGSGPNVASMETYPDAGLPGMCQDHPAQGAAMVDLLVGQLSRNESGVPAKPKTVLIPGYWVETAGG